LLTGKFSSGADALEGGARPWGTISVMTLAPPALDTVRSVATPEGVELDLRLAGPVSRACAWVVDFILRLVLLFVSWILLIPLGGIGAGASLIVAFLLEWLVPAACEVYFEGATPGKKLLEIQVVHDDGTPVGWGPALVRNLLRAVDFLPLFYGIGLISILLNRDFKRLGDLVAGTVVVYRESARRHAVIPVADPQPPTIPLTLAESRAVVALAERVATLTPERAAELAAIPAPIIGETGERAALAQMLQLANYLIGRRGS